MLRWWMMVAAVLVACNGDDKGTGGDDTDADDTDDTEDTTPTSRVDDILALTPDVTNGQALYGDECSLCHSADGTGGIGTNFVAELAEHADELDEEKEEWTGVVLDGIDGTTMAAYSANYTDQEIADIMGYIFETFGP